MGAANSCQLLKDAKTRRFSIDSASVKPRKVAGGAPLTFRGDSLAREARTLSQELADRLRKSGGRALSTDLLPTFLWRTEGFGSLRTFLEGHPDVFRITAANGPDDGQYYVTLGSAAAAAVPPGAVAGAAVAEGPRACGPSVAQSKVSEEASAAPSKAHEYQRMRGKVEEVLRSGQPGTRSSAARLAAAVAERVAAEQPGGGEVEISKLFPGCRDALEQIFPNFKLLYLLESFPNMFVLTQRGSAVYLSLSTSTADRFKKEPSAAGELPAPTPEVPASAASAASPMLHVPLLPGSTVGGVPPPAAGAHMPAPAGFKVRR